MKHLMISELIYQLRACENLAALFAERNDREAVRYYEQRQKVLRQRLAQLK
jgi:hypothetical protein